MIPSERELAMDLLGREGYEVAPDLDGNVVVKDPVSCQSGSRKWIEWRDETLTDLAEVRQFIEARS